MTDLRASKSTIRTTNITKGRFGRFGPNNRIRKGFFGNSGMNPFALHAGAFGDTIRTPIDRSQILDEHGRVELIRRLCIPDMTEPAKSLRDGKTSHVGIQAGQEHLKSRRRPP